MPLPSSTFLVALSLAALPAARPPALYDYKQLKPGMVMQGESVFARNGLEPFTATVLAVMEDFLGPNEDLILVRLGGETMERYGVVSGMSGSPVYVEGKLVGAVSYRFGSFPREPIAGITPAESMLTLLKHRENHAPRPANASLHTGEYGDAVPIETPLVCGGCTDETLRVFGPRLTERGFVPVRGSGGASTTKFPVFAGGPIGAALVTGDLTLAGFGTVTYFDGDNLLAFGHPYEGMGEAEVFMTSAEIMGTIPSLSGAHKLGRSGAVVGTFFEDRLVGIGGQVGPLARGVPFHLRFDSPSGLDARPDVRFNVVDDSGLGAMMAQSAFHSGLTAVRMGAEELGTIHMGGAITLADGRRVPFDETFSSVPARSPATHAALVVGELLESVWRNPFERARFKQVDITIRNEVEPHIGLIVRTAVEQTRIHAGDPIRARVEVRTHREGLQRFSVEIPTERSMEPGLYSVAFADGDEAGTYDRDAGLVPYPQSLNDIVDMLQKRRRGDRLYVYLLDRVTGARVAGRPMPELPPSMLAILNDGMEGPPAKKISRRAWKVLVVDPGMMVLGDAETSLVVLPPRGR